MQSVDGMIFEKIQDQIQNPNPDNSSGHTQDTPNFIQICAYLFELWG